MRVLVAPDKFKGTLTAPEAAEAISDGWRGARPGDEVERLPLADGGEGTLEVLIGALGGEIRSATVTGPLGAPVVAEFGLAGARGVPTGVVEMARASGLQLIPAGARDPLRATTFGTGELLLAACAAGARRVIVCIGGSATNDGGAGMAQALGIRLLDGANRELPPGGAALRELDAIDTSGLSPLVVGVEVEIASDVDNPLLGQEGASAVFGPQKGASEAEVRLLDEGLGRLAEVLRNDLGVDVAERPGSGAAGGLGAGLMAFLGAEARPGIDIVMEAVELERRLLGAGLVITGEGKLDHQSLRGKAPAGVLRLAREAGVPAVVLCGRAEVRPSGVMVESLVDAVGYQRAVNAPRDSLRTLAERVAREWHGVEGGR